MRRIGCLLLVFLFILPTAAAAEKHSSWPDIFKVDYEIAERKEDKNRYYIYKEYLKTTNSEINQELAAIVDAYDEQLFPIMQPDPVKNAKKNSRLDIETSHFFTGDSWISTMVQARVSFQRKQLSCDVSTRTYDLLTGRRVLLTDIFAEESQAWKLLSERTASHIDSLFPSDSRNPEAIQRLCSRASLESAEFTLSAMELTLHFQACDVYPDRPGLMHVRFFYDELWEYMTDEGKLQTDNTDYKMVALTCDDGPSYGPTNHTISEYRKYGARVTYFTVGKKVADDSDVLMREFDQNHLIASHSYDHWSGYSMNSAAMHKQLNKHNELLLNITGEPVTLFRAPGGTYPPWIEADIGLPIIQWSVDTYDYTGKSAKRIFYSIRNNTIDGDIILLHDSGKTMYKSISIYADWLRANGFMMVTVEELAHANNITMEPNVVYYRLFEGEYGERE